jgi:hypothetical protein
MPNALRRRRLGCAGSPLTSRTGGGVRLDGLLELLVGDPAQVGDEARGVDHVRALVAVLADGLGRQVRRVGLDEHPVQRHALGVGRERRRLRIGHVAGERDPPAALEALVETGRHREAVEDHLDALGAGGEHVDGVVLRRAGVDDERLAGSARDLDLRQERALLVLARRAVAVVVEPGLPHRAAEVVPRQLGKVGRGGVVEVVRGVRVPPDRGEHLVEPLRRGERRAVAVLVHPDREDALHARLARRRHQLVLGRGAVVEMGVRVDHWP